MATKRRDARYKEVSLPLMKITRTGGCLALLIPEKIAKKHKLNFGDKVIVTLLKRQFKMSDEMSDEDVRQLAQQISTTKEDEDELERVVNVLKNKIEGKT